MAEFFGVAAGVAGFVSLMVQIGEGASKLRAIHDSAGKAATDISTLIRELDLLTYVMQDMIAQASSRNGSLVQHCQADCDQVIRDLKSLITKMPPTSKRTTKANAVKFLAFRDWKENVVALKRSIQGAKINLILISTYKNSNQLKELALELLKDPWGFSGAPWEAGSQPALLELFMREFRMNKGTESKTFLDRCASWAKYGLHLDLLDTLLSLGYSATEGNFQEWPEPFEQLRRRTSDPFLMKYIKDLCEERFAAMTPLHEAVLFGTISTVEQWIPKSNKDEKNSLGQTPLHLTVPDPQSVKALIDSGHSVDSTDVNGITPLMYAAALNHEDSVMLLIQSGADAYTKDQQDHDFLHFAAVCGNWTLIFNFLTRLKDIADKTVVEGWTESAVILYHIIYPDRPHLREISLTQFLAKLSSVNFTFDDVARGTANNSLLHFPSTIPLFETLSTAGFKLFNHQNSSGQTPLMVAASSDNPELVKRLLERGTDISLKDRGDCTALDIAFNRRNCALGLYGIFETDRLVRMSDADIDAKIDEESDFLDILESEMEVLSTKDYEHLLNDWYLQSKARFDESCEETNEENEEIARINGITKLIPLVDRKRDCFRYPFCYWGEKDAHGKMKSAICNYICWIEHEYHHGDILKIPIEELIETLRNLHPLIDEDRYGHINIEEIVQHFLESFSRSREV
ncbi:hypothetical protein CMEL01_03687 [Colletotrichum melonis]|uniref:Fungal N-terminal domain-containing protein n=1 Tax=Colletotrichum melonis TaxID=1209925 RepID=A0AAI9XLQ0_9PEZI|nr:hypothetical protein CMEL01_03687 [Colletotrichum melonis]